MLDLSNAPLTVNITLTSRLLIDPQSIPTRKHTNQQQKQGVISAVVDTTFVDIYVDTKNIPTCRYNIQHIDKRTMEK